LRQRKSSKNGSKKRPLIAVVVDGVTGYGRAVMRGVMRYANIERRWLLHEELRHVLTGPLTSWPKCDGAILAGVSNDIVQAIRKRCPHVVRCSGSADPRETPAVSLDDHAVGAIAADHLMDCQLKSFGFYGYLPGASVAAKRFEGFRNRLAERGFECSDAGVGWPGSADQVSEGHGEQVIAWLQALPKPAGVMAIDDSAAHELAAMCLRANINVPDRVAIVGVNNDDLLCDSAWPPLSSVEGDYSRAGYLAAQMLERMLRGEKLKASERVIRLAPLGVVRRLSTDVLAVDDPEVAEAVRFIREHACDPCGVGDVLRHVPVGRRWLERQFKRKLGRNPHDEIMRVRIEAAKRLLLQPELTLPDVAERCGFAVVQNFGRAFAGFTGTTPGTFRRAARHGAAG
jgi:LacI family transcriptional regulator